MIRTDWAAILAFVCVIASAVLVAEVVMAAAQRVAEYNVRLIDR